KSTNLDAVLKVPDDEDSDYGHTADFDQNTTDNKPESADTDSDTYETASEGEPDENKTQIHHGNLSSNATLSKDPSEFETLKSTDTLLPREYTIFAPFILKDTHFINAVTETIIAPNEELITAIKNDKNAKNIISKYQLPENNHKNFRLSNGLLLFKNKLYIPDRLIPKFLDIFHDNAFLEHPGIEKTL
ncbi:hypothetical protein BB560_004937, partial [Smittium megazygosporum]